MNNSFVLLSSICEMIGACKYSDWLSWPVLRAHFCTLAISVTFNSTWRVPREGFRHGGVAYGLAVTVAMVLVALPLTLLQLAIGQLSQQDAVGIWRAVPFFKGIGYIRLLISFVGAAYSMVYLALTIAYFLYTATHNIPFIDCIHIAEIEEEYVNEVNASECIRLTFMSPVSVSPEYYLAVALISAVLWIASAFVFYNTLKLMKRIMYLLAPVIVILGVVIASCIGNSSDFVSIVDSSDWVGYKEPHVWISAVIQVLWSSQVAGGFLIVASDSVYASTNIQWTAVTITCANIVSSWFWLIFWYSISGPGAKDTEAAAVVVQIYQAAMDKELEQPWPLMVFITLILSGVITMLVLVYPIYDRLRRIGGIKWRLASFASSLVGAGASAAVLYGRLPVLTLVEDFAVPLLICFASIVEVLALGFVYGWRNLVEDVEFLIGSQLIKYWVWGWWVTPAVITPVAVWWLTVILTSQSENAWMVEEASTMTAAAAVAGAVFLVCAGFSVARQVQYDVFEKFKSSFQPSRHWGPRDPITHYYWLARREDLNRGNVPSTRYYRRELGQFSRRISFLTNNSGHSKTDLSVNKSDVIAESKQRSNSDDWLYTTGRKDFVFTVNEKKRSKSLDWDFPRKSGVKDSDRSVTEDSNNNFRF